jgi:hypothetical protein
MRILFDVNDAAVRSAFLGQGLAEALAPLAQDRKPQWGGFTAQQMVEHLLWAFEISTGRITVACPMPEDWQAKARGFLHSNRPTPQNFENPHLREGVPALRFDSIPPAVLALQAEARRFLELSESDPGTRYVHPVFGPATVEEWSRTQFKHCVHHFLQFDLIEVEEKVERGHNA